MEVQAVESQDMEVQPVTPDAASQPAEPDKLATPASSEPETPRLGSGETSAAAATRGQGEPPPRRGAR